MANNKKGNAKMKGDVFYTSFLGFEAGPFTFIKNKYVDFECIENYCDLEFYDKVSALIEKLQQSGAIKNDEAVMLSDLQYYIFNAFIKWMDNNDNVKILIG